MALIKLMRGQIWEVNLEPQTHKEEPGKQNRPALVIQTDLLNTISNKRFMGTRPLATLGVNHLKRIEEAIRLLIGL